MSATMCTLSFDERRLTGPADQPLIDFLAAHGIELPHVCYHPALAPLQTCDVCWRMGHDWGYTHPAPPAR